MKLSRSDQKELCNAIRSAYPTKEALEQFTYFELEESLDKIAGGNNITAIIFNLITQWAISQGKLEELIEKAYHDNEDNPELKDFYNKKIKPPPSIYNELGGDELSSERSQIISKWNELYVILNKVNDNQLITKICQETLKNSQNDFLGTCPELSNTIDLNSLKKILLTKFPKRNDDVPTIIEFAERLSRCQIEKPLSSQLEQWIQSIAQDFDLALPTYADESVRENNNNIYIYFLLITVIPKGKNKFDLESDLLSYNALTDSYQSIPKFLDCENRNLMQCDFTEIKDKVGVLVEVCQDYLQIPYRLNLELFLTYPYLGYAFEFDEIVIDQQRNSQSSLGKEYPLFVSSYDRFSNKKHYNQFLLRWRSNVQNKLKPNLAKFIESLKELESYNHQNLDELANQWEVQEIIGLKIMGCWYDEADVQQDLFYYIVKSGIPLVLWLRSNDLTDPRKQLKDLLTQPLNNWNDLFEQVWKCRKQAYKKPEKIGYHLGILADDPQRIPSHFKPLIETGK
ncbi:effector-associated domain EAD1-containing protein [Crocosphaera sp.]|uniref:effector-associated domain EAD1-containing protein n=1 Tax=Crocosphaera sp. TaxID=2729996 RepID=UPI002624FA6B|nr:effector-associated domain EAD1-containing protein [Crocosphaera sp.]MDJ0580695.1 effector-associated domain EAD1-containing protein [Crocosphaera sp.]